MSLSKDTKLGRGEVPGVFINLGRNSIARDITLDFIADQWDTVVFYYGSYGLSKIMEGVLSNRNTQPALDKIKAFQADKEGNLRTSERAINQAIEKTEANIAWVAKYYEEIKTWLSERRE